VHTVIFSIVLNSTHRWSIQPDQAGGWWSQRRHWAQNEPPPQKKEPPFSDLAFPLGSCARAAAMAALRLPSPPTARWAPVPSQAPRSTCASSYARRVDPSRRLTARQAKGQNGESEEAPAPVRTLLIDNYDSYTYNIFQELSVVNGGEYRLCTCCCVG
jgi:hypothetical protein